MWEETPDNYSRENPRSQEGTENPIHIMYSAPGGIWTGVLEVVEGKVRHHNTNLMWAGLTYQQTNTNRINAYATKIKQFN